MTTRQVALLLGLTVRSVQLMVDRGDLQAWRTPGGHRRITRESFALWRLHGRSLRKAKPAPSVAPLARKKAVLLIEDSVHFQSLVKLLFAQQFPELELHIAGDGVSGLSLAGQLQPQVLIIDILLPGIDGATLISILRSHPQFDRSRVLVLTSLDTEQLQPYALALGDVPVVHKPQLVADLPPMLSRLLLQMDLQGL